MRLKTTTVTLTTDDTVSSADATILGRTVQTIISWKFCDI